VRSHIIFLAKTTEYHPISWSDGLDSDPKCLSPHFPDEPKERPLPRPSRGLPRRDTAADPCPPGRLTGRYSTR